MACGLESCNTTLLHLANAFVATYSMASAEDTMLAASASGMQMQNSFSNAAVTSDLFNVSNPRSLKKEAVGVT
jgi:hypothetical protein